MRKAAFSIPLPSPWSRSVMLRSAKSEHPRLTNGEIIFEDFQLMQSRYLNGTDGQTDGRHCHSNSAYRALRSIAR